jgi:putative DNA primase/helicase
MSDNDGAENVIPLDQPNDSDELRSISHQQLMRDFVLDHTHTIRYVEKWKSWYIWNGSRWKLDEKLGIQWSVLRFIHSVSKRLKASKYERLCSTLSDALPRIHKAELRKKFKLESKAGSKELESISTAYAVVSMTKSHPDVASVTDDWDKNPWLLNTPDGAVDLKSGNIRKSDKFDYMTKSTAVSPSLTEPTLWLSFLRKIMSNDEDMVRYLQRVFGYCLVGEPKQHEMYFGYGTGRNGKGTTLRAITGLLGDYAGVANIETFIINKSERHPTELASLRGARLVTCGETNEGQHWAEARIKELTGGDPIKARFMRQDEFTYVPQFKLFLTGNHKPRLRNVDAAIEARFRLIPFAVHIPDHERDLDLDNKLKLEWPQILHWCIEGCLMWQSDGLKPPAAVANATKTYLTNEDSLTLWLSECTALTTGTFTYIEDLFKSWQAYCIANNEPSGTKRELQRKLEDRTSVIPITRTRRAKGNGFAGIEILTPVKSDE